MTFTSNATWIDVFIVVAYLALIMWIGIWFSRRQTSMKEYFLAGRNMGWLPVGLSLMGAIHSGIQYILGAVGDPSLWADLSGRRRLLDRHLSPGDVGHPSVLPEAWHIHVL